MPNKKQIRQKAIDALDQHIQEYLQATNPGDYITGWVLTASYTNAKLMADDSEEIHHARRNHQATTVTRGLIEFARDTDILEWTLGRGNTDDDEEVDP